MVNNAFKCKEASDDLLNNHGIYIQPINYPTVEEGTERLRIAPTPFHDDVMMVELVQALEESFVMIYENKFGKVDILPDPDFWDGHIIGIAMSGGADSLMLCYLVANTIKKLKLNSSIQPYNGYDIHVPHDSNAAVKTLPTLIRKFPTVDIKWPISTVFNSNGEDNKMDYITKLRKALAGATFTRHITGITLGPPYKVQNSWPKNGE
jgi:hypothetical protein